MSRPRFAVEAGRQITRDGLPFLVLQREVTTAPTMADAMVHEIVRLLNRAKTDPDKVRARHLKKK